MYRGLKYNASGCVDKTAYYAIISALRKSKQSDRLSGKTDTNKTNNTPRKVDKYAV